MKATTSADDCTQLHFANYPREAAHPDSPALLRELDLRRGRLPWIDRPRQYSTRSSRRAFDLAYEDGYRGWPKINPYKRCDSRNAWDAGYDAGEAEFQNRMAGSSRNRCEAYINGFHSGFNGLRKKSPYWDGGKPQFAGQVKYNRTWLAGYRDGSLASTEPIAA
jgi:hypothetical protein